MYEFTKKELRKKFKETEYGKKVDKYLKVSIVVFGISILIPFVIGFIHGVMGTTVEELEEMMEVIDPLLSGFIYISAIIAIYFDGKRDGAIEEYKRSINCKD